MKKTHNDINLPLLSEFVEMRYKGHKYTIEHFYYKSESPDMRYTTIELDQDFFDRLEQLHRDRKISEILKKN